jgi:predicted PolB exonuclease-like 3'-5' exonuclease
MDLFSNFGATRVSGGLNLLANIIGKPGKTEMDGSKVQDLYDAGGVKQVNDYCRCDVLDTYFVFLRSRVLLGQITLEEEQRIVGETKGWLEARTEGQPAFAQYLEHWGDWRPPAEG